MRIKLVSKPITRIIAKANTVKITGTPSLPIRIGVRDHSQLNELDYENSGHIGFQKALVYNPAFKAYEIES